MIYDLSFRSATRPIASAISASAYMRATALMTRPADVRGAIRSASRTVVALRAILRVCRVIPVRRIPSDAPFADHKDSPIYRWSAVREIDTAESALMERRTRSSTVARSPGPASKPSDFADR